MKQKKGNGPLGQSGVKPSNTFKFYNNDCVEEIVIIVFIILVGAFLCYFFP